SLNFPSFIAVEPISGDVYIADTGNNRVLIFATVSSNNPDAVYVIGRPDFTTQNSSSTVSGSTMLSPSGITFSGSGGGFRIYIADSDFNRVLVFGSITTNGQSALFALGQSDFTSSASATTQSGLAAPSGLAVDGSNRLYVADSNNNRVMLWSLPISSNNQAANAVLGQGFYFSNGAGVSTTSMDHPAGISIGSNGNLYVVDRQNNRVLVWTNSITTNGQAANIVLGQS